MIYNPQITTPITATVMTPMVALADVMSYSIGAVVFLIFLLALKLIVISEGYKNTKIAIFNKCLNMVISPLLFVLLFLVAFTVVNILRTLYLI